MKRLFNGLGKMLFILSQPLLIIYFRINSAPRVRIIVKDNEDNILLVKGWFGTQQWELPGGGIEKSESPEAAARRELREETGLEIELEDIVPIGSAVHKRGLISYKIILFTCQVPSLARTGVASGRWWEIISVNFFPIRRLPDDTGNLVQRSLLRAREVN